MADTTLRSVTVNLTCGQPESRLFNVQWPVGSGDGRAVEESDIRRRDHRRAGCGRRWTGGRSIHALPLTFSTDDTDRVTDPRGLFCTTLTARLHIIDAATSALRSLGRLHRALRSGHRRNWFPRRWRRDWRRWWKTNANWVPR